MFYRKIIFISITLFVFAAAISSTVFAADLSIEVDKETNIALVSNSLPYPVTLLNLLADEQHRLPLFCKLKPGGTEQIKLRFDMPKTVSYAVCEISSPLNQIKKSRDNYYHLSVEIQIH